MVRTPWIRRRSRGHDRPGATIGWWPLTRRARKLTGLAPGLVAGLSKLGEDIVDAPVQALRQAEGASR